MDFASEGLHSLAPRVTEYCAESIGMPIGTPEKID